MASLISSVLWVPRGVSAQHPSKYDLSDPAELERVQKLGKIKLEDAQRDLEEMERLEKGVDGMAVDNDDGDGEGDEWEDDEDSEEDEDNDEKAAAKKAAAFAKAAKQVGGKSKKDEDPDDMSKYNLDTYDDERQKSTCTSRIAGFGKAQTADNHYFSHTLSILRDMQPEESSRTSRASRTMPPIVLKIRTLRSET